MQKARTRAPSATSRSTRWLPMKPSAPVTSTLLFERLVTSGSRISLDCSLGAALAGQGQLLALTDVDPVILDLEGPHHVAALHGLLHHGRHVHLLTPGDARHQLRLEHVE